jgi:hypothetical protein
VRRREFITVLGGLGRVIGTTSAQPRLLHTPFVRLVGTSCY